MAAAQRLNHTVDPIARGHGRHIHLRTLDLIAAALEQRQNDLAQRRRGGGANRRTFHFFWREHQRRQFIGLVEPIADTRLARQRARDR
jgi:hypothetical protein